MTPESDPTIAAFNQAAPADLQAACDWLGREITGGLPGAEAKVWHRTAVWFLAGNPVAGYSPRKAGVQLLFWSGQSFGEPGLRPEGKFMAAEVMLRPPAISPPPTLPAGWPRRRASSGITPTSSNGAVFWKSWATGNGALLAGGDPIERLRRAAFSRLWRKRQPARGQGDI